MLTASCCASRCDGKGVTVLSRKNLPVKGAFTVQLTEPADVFV